MSNSYSKALAAAIDGARRGMAADLARLLGVDASFISQLKSGKRPVPAPMAPLIASELGTVRPEDISEEYVAVATAADGSIKPISSYEATHGQTRPPAVRRVRIEGSVAMDTDGFWQVGDDEAEVAVYQTDDPNAYAIRIRNNRFQPTAALGQCFIVSPGTEVKIGRPVLIVLKDGRRTIRNFAGAAHGVLSFTAINNGNEHSDIPEDQVERLERAMGAIWLD